MDPQWILVGPAVLLISPERMLPVTDFRCTLVNIGEVVVVVIVLIETDVATIVVNVVCHSSSVSLLCC